MGRKIYIPTLITIFPNIWILTLLLSIHGVLKILIPTYYFDKVTCIWHRHTFLLTIVRSYHSKLFLACLSTNATTTLKQSISPIGEIWQILIWVSSRAFFPSCNERKHQKSLTLLSSLQDLKVNLWSYLHMLIM